MHEYLELKQKQPSPWQLFHFRINKMLIDVIPDLWVLNDDLVSNIDIPNGGHIIKNNLFYYALYKTQMGLSCQQLPALDPHRDPWPFSFTRSIT